MFRDHINTADKLTTAPGLFMITLSSIALGAAFGGYLPLISLWLETLGVSFQKIGLVSGMAALGIVSSAYFAPHLVARYGNIPVINIGLCLAAVMMVALRLFMPLVKSLVQTDEARPYFDSLAQFTASSTSEKGVTETTGPKTSF